MGGFGSGRNYFYNTKNTVEDYHKLDVRELQKRNLLIPGKSFSWRWFHGSRIVSSISIVALPDCIMLSYRNPGSSGTNESYCVQLESTPCYFGGQRHWFICPAKGCKQRVAILYGGKIFACRHCYNLAYPCQREAPDTRALSRSNKIRNKLNWPHRTERSLGDKPKGMHWKTFMGLVNQHNDYLMRWLSGMDRFMERIHCRKVMGGRKKVDA